MNWPLKQIGSLAFANQMSKKFNLLQARSQAYVSGVTKFSSRNHVVQNLRAFFHNLCFYNPMDNVYEKNIKFSIMSQRPRLCSKKNSEDLSP